MFYLQFKLSCQKLLIVITVIMECYFCPNELDNSDEHIILNSLNGKLHSKLIICSDCNGFFGRNLDTVAKELFNPILLALDFKNASGIIAENFKGDDDYLLKKDKSIIQRKPTVNIKKSNGRTLVSISGDEKNVTKLYEKEVEKLLKAGRKKIGSIIEKGVSNIPLRLKAEFKSSARINLLLNKIAVEFCAHNKITTSGSKKLALRIRSLDEDIDNVYYCCDVENCREFQSGELSHYLKLFSTGEFIYAYVELLNIICAVVVIADDYEGEEINYHYYQDAITREEFNDFPNLGNDFALNIVQANLKSADFSELANMVFKRKRDRDFTILLDEVIYEIIERLQKELSAGKISKAEFEEKYVDETAMFIAQYQIDNPYMWEDLDDAHNDDLNYIHSNMRESQFENFRLENQAWIGKIIKFDNLKSYAVEEFIKIPIAKQNDIIVVNVKVVLYNGFDRLYIPYRELFEGSLDE